MSWLTACWCVYIYILYSIVYIYNIPIEPVDHMPIHPQAWPSCAAVTSMPAIFAASKMPRSKDSQLHWPLFIEVTMESLDMFWETPRSHKPFQPKWLRCNPIVIERTCSTIAIKTWCNHNACNCMPIMHISRLNTVEPEPGHVFPVGGSPGFRGSYHKSQQL